MRLAFFVIFVTNIFKSIFITFVHTSLVVTNVFTSPTPYSENTLTVVKQPDTDKHGVDDKL